MIATDQVQSWLDQHAQLASTEVDWLAAQRQAALARFEQTGLPGVRDEQWRYTNLRALKSKALSLSSPSSAESTLNIELPSTELPRLVFVDGHLHSKASSALAMQGLHCTSLSRLLADKPDELKDYFSCTLNAEQHGFTALNTAFSQDGYVVSLPKGESMSMPLEVVFISQANNSVHHLRNLIVAQPNSQCTIIERHIGASDAVYLNSSVTDMIAEDNAHIDHYKIQQESDAGFHIGGVFIKQSAGSQVKNHNVALSGLVTRNDINCDLNGGGAHVEMNGLILGKGRQHVDNHTEVNHAVANCTSDEYYKTILDDKSRSVFRGRIIVAQDAQQTNADQQNNNLLLSDKAEADCKPQLEIYADDVKCSHGATVGQLDKTSLFYLKSRGISQASAQALLTFAFANEVLDRIQVTSIKSELRQLIAGELLEGLEGLI